MLPPIVIRGITSAISMGVRMLVPVARSAINFCTVQLRDCLFVVNAVVMNVWYHTYYANNGINARDTYGRRVYATAKPPHWDEKKTGIKGMSLHSRLPIDGPRTSLAKAAIQHHRNDTWLHIATMYSEDKPVFHLRHRLVHEDDLGKVNDGNYHHFQAMQASEGLAGRAESSFGGIVSDYLWRAGQQDIWNQVHDGVNAQGVDFGTVAGDVVADWQENGSVASGGPAEATCASLVTQHPTGEGPQQATVTEDHGVMAYGWNNAPFVFNGRAGGWVDSCSGQACHA
jgi:hypothetical protein